MFKIVKSQKGFTLVELMVTIAIFVFMTGVLVAKYKSFDNGVVLKNLAYDIALSIRSAQSYGLNVKSASNSSFSGSGTYTVTFNTSNNTQFVLNGADTAVITNIRGGSYIDSLCAGSGQGSSCSNVSPLTISFTRPSPNANINGSNAYAEIVVKSRKGDTRKIVIRNTGQIYVEK